MQETVWIGRRRMMRASLAAGGLALSGGLLSVNASSAQRAKVGMQLSFLANGNQVGEVAAKQLGYYEQENIDFSILPGGPSSDGIAVIESTLAELEKTSPIVNHP